MYVKVFESRDSKRYYLIQYDVISKQMYVINNNKKIKIDESALFYIIDNLVDKSIEQ